MKILRYIFFTFILLTLLLIIGVSGVAYFYGEEIKTFVVNELNKNLKTEVEVKQVNFSVWENFPSASVVFSDVVIHAVDAKNDTLLAAKKLSATFNLIDLYQKKYRLNGLKISDGICNMQVDHSGRENYVFWNQESTTDSKFSTELKRVNIKNMQFSYRDFSKHSEVYFLIENANLKGSFRESIFDLDISSVLKHSNFRFGELSLFEDRTLFVTAVGKVNQVEQNISFANANLGVDAMNLSLTGEYAFSNEPSINLQVESTNTDLEKAIALLPTGIRNRIERFDIEGFASFKGSISGAISAISVPSYRFNFSIENGRFNDKKSEVVFTNSNLRGSITNGAASNLETTELMLDHFDSKLKDGKVEGSLQLTNFKSPVYHFQGNLAFNLNEAVSLLKLEDLEKAKGTLGASINVKGQLASIEEYTVNDWKNSNVQGKVKLGEVGFKYKSQPRHYSSINGELTFNNNSLTSENLVGKIDETQLTIKGDFNNLIGFLIDEKEQLLVDASVYSPNLDLSSLLATNSPENDKQKSYKLSISPRLTIYLETKVDELIFNQFNLTDLECSFIVKDQRIDARNISFNSQGGTVEGDLFIRELGNGKLKLLTQADLLQVNINKLFKSFNNFGQATLTAENISGTADAFIRFNSDWSEDLKIDQKSIEIEADFAIREGELNNFKPLESLSKFVELEELKKVKFKTIQNQIAIKDETITIPRFDVYSSALNVSLAGTHTFDNAINYQMTLLLSELLGRKAKKPANEEFGYVEDDGQGRTKLFLKMTGTVENPSIKYDAAQLKTTIKEKFSQEKQTFKSILKEEFGLFKKDSSLKTNPSIEKRRKSPFQVEIDSSYVKKRTKEGEEVVNSKDKKQKKSKFGKILDKIAKPNEDEFVEPLEN